MKNTQEAEQYEGEKMSSDQWVEKEPVDLGVVAHTWEAEVACTI